MTRAPSHHRRFPVRNPRAGILADWFGVDGGSAKVLLTLYEASEPLHAATIAERAPLPPGGSVKTLCKKLRAAGLDVLSRPGRHHAGYSLSAADRRAVREAFAHTLTLLGREVPHPDDLEARLAELRAYRAADDRHRAILRVREAFGVQACVARVLLRLAQARGEYVSTPLLVAALPRDLLADEPSGKYTSTLVCLARKAMGGRDAIDTAHGFGYRLTVKGLAMVDGALAAPTLVEGGFA